MDVKEKIDHMKLYYKSITGSVLSEEDIDTLKGFNKVEDPVQALD
jgi:hypothetical protein